MCFDLKLDLMRKEQLVIGGDMTGDSEGYAYYGVVNINTNRKYFFLGNINDIVISDADVGNLCTQYFTK